LGRKGDRGKGQQKKPGNGQKGTQVVPGRLEDEKFRLMIGLCCTNCAFGQTALDSKDKPTGMVTCHAGAPAVVGSQSIESTRDRLTGADLGADRIQPYTMWPMLKESEWCGVFTSPDEWLLSLSKRFGDEAFKPPPESEVKGANDDDG
jgi:hypothetical protein